MDKRHVSFSKIPQFRDVVRNVGRQSQFVGLDANNEPIINPHVAKPTITFNGTVKLHGSNGAVCVSDEGEIWSQSRKKILSIEADNNGFYQFCHDRLDCFVDLLDQIPGKGGIKSIFGEYCGKGINQGAAIHELPKMFVIFAVKIVPVEGDSYYINSDGLRNSEARIYNIADFKTFRCSVDFNYPELSQNTFVELVDEVENECPVGKSFGVSGVGEGIVWTGEYDGVRHVFKTKGQKHSVSKVRKVGAVDIEKINSIKGFVEYSVTENRLNQAVTEVFEGENPTIKKMGDFLRWIMRDIAEEEADTLGTNGLVLKDVGRAVSNKARAWFQELLDENRGMN